MRNCVGWGGYADKSFGGESKIFSVRDNKFSRVATMEVSISYDFDEFKVIQLYGYDNADVNDTVKKAAEWFAKEINEGGSISIDINALKMEQKIHDRKEHGDSYVSHGAGCAITEDAIRAAMVPWKPFLPRELYNAPLSKWLEIDYVRKAVERINEDQDAIIIDKNGDWHEG